MSSIKQIIELAGKYMPEDNIALISKAYDYACMAYEDNPLRKSGESYISHPLAVAAILVSMRLDVHTVIAGLLHKVLRGRQFKSSETELKKLFGRPTAAIVSGATKIDEIQFNSRLDYKAENVKKMILAMSSDIRVLNYRNL